MNKPLRYPIGEQDYANIRNDGMVYIDKTDLKSRPPLAPPKGGEYVG